MPRSEITQLLRRVGEGDRAALDRLWEELYAELKVIARRQLRDQGATLNTTALVHEAYLRLVDKDQVRLNDRGHFFALAARVMRHIVVDFARRGAASKRGGQVPHLALDEVELAIGEQAQRIVLIDEALERLSTLNERLTHVFECRFFGGLTEAETAAALDVPLRTVQRDWLKSKAWLRRELSEVA